MEALDLHGCWNGFVVTFHGEEVAKWQTLTGAAHGLRLAREALAMLEQALASVPQARAA